MDEESFWRRTNPARLHALFDAWFSLAAAEPRRESAPQEKNREKKSLYEYLKGG